MVDATFEAIGIVMETAAVRTIDPGNLVPAKPQDRADKTGISTAFRAVSVQDIGFQVANGR